MKSEKVSVGDGAHDIPKNKQISVFKNQPVGEGLAPPDNERLSYVKTGGGTPPLQIYIIKSVGEGFPLPKRTIIVHKNGRFVNRPYNQILIFTVGDDVLGIPRWLTKTTE